MTGTSADGIDVALVEISDKHTQLCAFISPELPPSLKKQLIDLNGSPQIELKTLSQLSVQIAQSLSQATQQLLTEQGLSPSDICAIGSHGQTIYHAPEIPMTLQIGHPAIIAKQCQIQTVGDFRVDDMALGGQGAPFAPAFHQQLFQEETKPCFVVNIGGIANVSHLPSKIATQQAPKGYDTGPGNALMDELCQQHFNQAYDESGLIAASGSVQTELLNQLLSHPFFAQPHPKSTGRDIFNQNWLNDNLQVLGLAAGNEISYTDLLCTLCELTALSIANEIFKIIQQEGLTSINNIPVWIVGGGAYNQHLISRIQSHLSQCLVQSSEQKNINPNAIEAMMCAWLAYQRINNQTVALSQVTGAKRDAVLGGLWHP